MSSSGVVQPCNDLVKIPHPEDGGSKVLRNVGILPHHYTPSEPTRRRLEFIETLHGVVHRMRLHGVVLS
jgi:hypothetical protein